jgi:prepilin-type processing-associated H-X9-DG protein
MVQILPYIEQDALYRQMQAIPGGQGTPLGGAWTDPYAGTLVSTYVCPSDPRSGSADGLIFNQTWDGHGNNHKYATTCYVCIIGWDYYSGDTALKGTAYGMDKRGIMTPWPPFSTFASVIDGLSNTLLIGERPPGSDLDWGWFVSGGNDVMSGVANQSQNYSKDQNGKACPPAPHYFQPPDPGGVSNPCSNNHLYSMHPGGGNFVFGDGSVRFLSYSVPFTVMEALSTFAGGELIDASQY